MNKLYFAFLITFACLGCNFHFQARKSAVKSIKLYATSVTSNTFMPIYREYFISNFFPNHLEYGDGRIKRVFSYQNRKDSIYNELSHLILAGHIDFLRQEDVRENIRILCEIRLSHKTLKLWINQGGKSCIIGDSIYYCSAVLKRQLCYFVPETYICEAE